MKTSLKIVAAIAALLLPVIASSQVGIALRVPGSETFSNVVTEDGDTGIVCRYIGTSANGKIAVAAGGDLTFTDGDIGSEAATDTFECPVSGALGGIIDVSDSACNTIGEVVDIVNASSDWRCQPASMLRADSSNDTLVTISATNATDPKGLKLKVDSSVALFSTVVAAPAGWDDFDKLNPGNNSTSFFLHPWAFQRAYISTASALSTYGSGTSLLSVISVDRTFGATGADTSTTVWPSTAGGATTVVKNFGGCDTPATGCDTAWGAGGLFCPAGQQCMVRLTNDTALSVNTVGVSGLSINNSGLGVR